jgi:hypothetical protein
LFVMRGGMLCEMRRDVSPSGRKTVVGDKLETI